MMTEPFALELLETGQGFDRQLPVFNWYYPFDLALPQRPNWREAYGVFSQRQRLAVYVHVPFCDTICNFCPFSREQISGNSPLDAYVNALVAEFRLKRRIIGRPKVDAVSIGGGTPTVLSAAQLTRLCEEIQSNFEIDAQTEFTCEVEAKSVSQQKLEALSRTGANRFSIGIQTTAERHRALFDLTVSVDRIRDVVRMLNDSADYTNMDVIYAIPGQTPAELLEEVRVAQSFATTTIDFYPLNNLAAQPAMHRRARQRGSGLVSARQRADFRAAIDAEMEEAGYDAISGYSYCRPLPNRRKRSRFIYHDILYGYENDLVIGYGASAVTYMPGFNVYNEVNTGAYIKSWTDENPLQWSVPNGSSAERGIVTFPYRGDLKKDEINWERVPEETRSRFDIAQRTGMILEGKDHYSLSRSGWLNYVNLMYFLMPLRGREALSHRIQSQISRGKSVEDVYLQ